jgi:hypothetical protein
MSIKINHPLVFKLISGLTATRASLMLTTHVCLDKSIATQLLQDIKQPGYELLRSNLCLAVCRHMKT